MNLVPLHEFKLKKAMPTKKNLENPVSGSVYREILTKDVMRLSMVVMRKYSS
jgi:hypothetical protein